VPPDELLAWLRLTLTPGIGNATARKLLAAFGLPQAVFEQSQRALQQAVGSTLAQALCTEPAALPALHQHTLDWLAQAAASAPRREIVSVADAGYPRALLSLDDPPLLLYLLGSASYKENQPVAPADTARDAIKSVSINHSVMTQRSVAVVGSRNPTAQGLSHAREFAAQLVQSGYSVVSGLALGIDGAAHEGALSGSVAAGPCAQAATVAVVGTGLDRVYPRAHRDLAHRIAQNGLLISEYPLGTPPLTANFPRRNRLIAALAQGTLVVEATLKSGSLITARLSSEQGREVFAVPGSIHAMQSRGCHALIKQGAKLVESVQDILDELPALAGSDFAIENVSASADETCAKGQFDAENPVLVALGFDPLGLDALLLRTGLDTAHLQAELMALELDGRVARLAGGLFQRLA